MAAKQAAPLAARPDLIRNVLLVGPSSAGKTTLTEHLLVAAGALTRPGTIADGSTVSDFDELEISTGRSISLAVAAFMVGEIKINVLDSPGFGDFVGDVRAGLRAADAALFVIASTDGVDAATIGLWNECAAVGMPRAIVVTKIDKDRADFDETVAVAQRVFGEGVHPMYLPLLADNHDIAGVINLLTAQLVDYSTSTRSVRDADPEHLQLTEASRASLIEGVITESEDETLMDRFLDGEALDLEMLMTDLERAVARGHFYPVLPVAGTVGATELLELICHGFPSPLEHPLPTVTTPDGEPVDALDCNPDGELCAEVVKTMTDPYVGRISIVRVFSGTLRPDMVLHVSGHFAPDRGHVDHDLDERAGAISVPFGKSLMPTTSGNAGDIVAVSKLAHAETGDTLSSPDAPLLVESWAMPQPLLPVAIVAHSKADEDKLGQALARIVAEDPTLMLERNAATGQVVLWCLGDAHVEVVLGRLRGKHGVMVDSEELKVSLRETFATTARGSGRLVKQSGGHGQYAVVEIEVTPAEPGSGFAFIDKVVGGAVPRQFIASVEKGVRAQLEKGVHAGYPVVDVQVTLLDGKAHSVDSSDMAFQSAGALALKDAAANATITMLEPVANVSIMVADEFVGPVMSDVSTRRAHVLGSQSVGAGRTQIDAVVPELELTHYAIELRALAHGTGSFTRSPAGYEPMPPQVAAAFAS